MTFLLCQQLLHSSEVTLGPHQQLLDANHCVQEAVFLVSIIFRARLGLHIRVTLSACFIASELALNVFD